jgi:hypothetical protein
MKTHMLAGATLALLVAAGSATATAQDGKATEILGKTRMALGGAKLDAMRTFTLEAAAQRNVGERQMASEVELFLEMPDKYLKSEVSRGMMNMTMNSGFNGNSAILPPHASMAAGGGMVIRMGPGGPAPADAPKLTDEQRAEINKVSVRGARVELSHLTLGWFGAAHPSLNAHFTYAGEAESADGKAHVIDVKDADGFEARLFVDQNNYLPLMVAYKGQAPRMVTTTGPLRMTGAPPHGSGDTQTRPPTDEERKKLAHHTEARIRREMEEPPLVDFSLFFDDWRDVDGIRFPHVMRRASAGVTTEEWTVSKVKVNPKIDAKKFAVETR